MKRLTHDRRVFLLAAAAALPAMATSLVLLWTGDFTPKLRWTLTALLRATAGHTTPIDEAQR